MSLITHLQEIPDFRTQPRYPLWVVLLLIIMATMSGCLGYRATEEFVERHQAQLLELLKLPHTRLPSYSTLRKIMVRTPFEHLSQAFNRWSAETFAPQPGEQLPTDGKSIKASVRDYDQDYQDFVSVVSAFSVQQGVVVGLQPMHNQAQSEIATVSTLLEVLNLKGVCFSLDALHPQKKRLSKSFTVATTTSLLSKGTNPSYLSSCAPNFSSLPL
jgi:DDE_Tnp_1-associated